MWFWFWKHFKTLVYRGRVVTFADLKGGIPLHVTSIQVEKLRSGEQIVHTLQILYLLAVNHIE